MNENGQLLHSKANEILTVVRDMMDVVFNVSIVTRGAIAVRVWEYECFAMQMLYVCVLCASCGSS